jgi:hypothetical protein
MRGVIEEQLPAHLDELVFRWNHKGEDLFHLLLQLMGEYYNPHDIATEAGVPPPIIYKNI